MRGRVKSRTSGADHDGDEEVTVRVLVAEDDGDIGRLLDVTLSGFGHTVTVVANGAEAIAAFDRHRFDAVVLDVMMPGVDGYAVLRHIRSTPALQELPVVMLTAKVSEADHFVGYDSGADGYLTKPFRPVDLHDAVEDLLQQTPDQRRRTRVKERSKAELLRQLEHRF